MCFLFQRRGADNEDLSLQVEAINRAQQPMGNLDSLADLTERVATRTGLMPLRNNLHIDSRETAHHNGVPGGLVEYL